MFVYSHRQKQRGRTYTSILLCESFRDPKCGGKPRRRVIANLGPLDKVGEETLKSLGEGFYRLAGVPEPKTVPEAHAALVSAGDFGHVYAVSHVWERLGLTTALDQAGIAGSASFPASELVRLLVVNRVCDPCSKLALLDWLDSVHYGDCEKPSYQHLLRAMDRLLEVKETAEPLIARRFFKDAGPPDLVFYDITSTYFEGDRSLGRRRLASIRLQP